jgi:hypothetical protein
MSTNLPFTSGMSDPPIRANVVTDAQGNENTPGFQAILGQLWQGWVRSLTQWTNIQGQSNQVAYDATMFDNSSVGGWTPTALQIENFTYRFVGDTLFVNLDIISSTVTSLSAYLTVLFPPIAFGKYTPVEKQDFPCLVTDNSANWVLGLASVLPAATPVAIYIRKADGTSWTAGHTVSIGLSVSYQVRLT